MSYTDLRDFEIEYSYVALDGRTIQLEKLGGGTIGQAYTGTWRYILLDAEGVEVTRGQDYETHIPHTHEEAAKDLADFFDQEGV
jgi:hypothetical protein